MCALQQWVEIFGSNVPPYKRSKKKKQALQVKLLLLLAKCIKQQGVPKAISAN